MPASYPSSIKSFTTKTDNVTDVLAEHVNSLQDEVVAIETALGANLTAVKALDGVIKAWAEFNGTGTPALIDSFNITSISDVGAGIQTLTIATDFASANYVCVITHVDDNGSTPLYGTSAYYSKAAGSVNIMTGDNSGSAVDCASVSVIMLGDQ